MINVKLYKDNDGDWWAELEATGGYIVLGSGDTAALALEDLPKELAQAEMVLDAISDLPKELVRVGLSAIKEHLIQTFF
jgi:hypothetical protein